jgi:hypothetical protein
MQYILTQEEYDALRTEQALNLEIKRDQLQKLCTRIADNMPVSVKWLDNGRNPQPWGCILSVDHEHYCDHCPVQDICPSDRMEWSK